MILKQLSFSNKLGDNIVTVTNNVLAHIFEDFSCFTIIGDTGKLMENFRVTKVNISTRYLPQQPLSVDFSYTLTLACAFVYST